MILARGLFATLLLAALPAGAQEDVRDVAARVHREGDYGERLAVGDGAGGPRIVFGGGGGDAERQPTGERAPRRERSPGTISVPAGSSVFAYVLLGVAIVVIVGLLIGALARSRPGRGELAPPHVRAKARGAPPLPARNLAALAGDPEALAREGRYAEAIAAAMIEGLRGVGWRPDGHGKSRTAREVLASVDGADARRAALAELVRIEERVAFGGDEATRERWDEARARWVDLRSAPA